MKDDTPVIIIIGRNAYHFSTAQEALAFLQDQPAT